MKKIWLFVIVVFSSNISFSQSHVDTLLSPRNSKIAIWSEKIINKTTPKNNPKNSAIAMWSEKIINKTTPTNNPKNSAIAIWSDKRSMHNLNPEKIAHRRKITTRIAAIVIWSVYFYGIQYYQQ